MNSKGYKVYVFCKLTDDIGNHVTGNITNRKYKKKTHLLISDKHLCNRILKLAYKKIKYSNAIYLYPQGKHAQKQIP